MRHINVSVFAKSLATLLVAGSMGVAWEAQALVLNGSFETPLSPVGSFTSYTVLGQGITNWTVVGIVGDVAIVEGSFVFGGFALQAHSGKQWLDLTGTNPVPIGVSQTIATIPGNLYQLDYFVGNTSVAGLEFSSTVNVTLDGIQKFTSTNANTAATGMDWQLFSHQFLVVGNSITIGFINGDGDDSNGLDDVSLTDLGGPGPQVPEPGTLGLLSLGLATVAFSVRRRKAT